MHTPTQVEPSHIFESIKPPAVPSAASPGDVNRILADVEAYLQRLRDAQKAQEEAGTALAERMRRIERSEGDVDRARQELLRQQQSIQQERQELAKRLQAAEQNAADLARQLEAATKEAAQRARDLDKVESTARKSEERVSKLEKTIEKAKVKLGESKATRVSAAEESAKARKTLAALEQQVAERDAQLADTQRKLDEATRQLSELARSISDHKPQLERGAAALALVEQQQHQIEQLTTELAELKLRSDTTQVQRLEQRVAELTEALRQARGQNAGQSGLGHLEQRNAELEAELQRFKVALQTAQLEAAQAKQGLQEQLNANAVHATQEIASTEQNAKIAALTAEIERLQTRAAEELRKQLAAQSQLHQQELAKASSASPAEVRALQSRVKELEQALSAAKSSGPAESVSPVDSAKSLKAKAERISAVAEHLRRRRTRLEKMRGLMRKRTDAAGNPEQVAKLEREQSHLAEIRRMLAVSEQAMVRRWARPKAVTVTGALALIAVLCAIASWLIADHYFPARISASVGVEARTESRQPLDADAARSWRTWHMDLLHDPAFIKTLSQRLAERRVDAFADPDVLAQRLANDLSIDAHQNGMLVLTMAGDDEEEITSLLDILTATMISESGRNVEKRADRAAAVVTTERKDDGQIRYASVNAVPIHDSRLNYAGPLFGVMMALIIALTVFMYTRLCRVKRVFEDDSAYMQGGVPA